MIWTYFGYICTLLPVWGLSISGQLPVCHFQRGNDFDLFRVYLHITSGLGSFTSGLPFYAGIATVCFWDVSILLPVCVANLLPVGGEGEFDWIKFDWSSEPDALNIQMTTGNEALLISVIARWFVCDFFGGGRGLLSPGGREVFVSVCCGRGGRGRVDIFIAVTATMRETGLVAVYCWMDDSSANTERERERADAARPLWRLDSFVGVFQLVIFPRLLLLCRGVVADSCPNCWLLLLKLLDAVAPEGSGALKPRPGTGIGRPVAG